MSVDHPANNIHGAVDAWRHGDYYGAGAQAAAAALDALDIELTLPAMVMPFLAELGGAVDLLLDASLDGALDAGAGVAVDAAAGAAVDTAADAAVAAASRESRMPVSTQVRAQVQRQTVRTLGDRMPSSKGRRWPG